MTVIMRTKDQQNIEYTGELLCKAIYLVFWITHSGPCPIDAFIRVRTVMVHVVHVK